MRTLTSRTFLQKEERATNIYRLVLDGEPVLSKGETLSAFLKHLSIEQWTAKRGLELHDAPDGKCSQEAFGDN